MTFRFVGSVALVLSAFTAGCSLDEPVAAPVSSSTTIAETTTVAPTTSIRVVTSIERVPSSELTSAGEISVGDLTFSFSFECYAAGAGDVLAMGVGENVDGRSTQAIVQAFLGQPYVAVFVGADTVYELAIEREADLFVQGSDIRGSALRFVEPTESAGVGEEAGLGSVTVTCDGFAPGLPEGYVLADTTPVDSP